jgi:hypothetical protein
VQQHVDLDGLIRLRRLSCCGHGRLVAES